MNANGKVLKETGIQNFCPFLYQGQSFDNEIELAYNRFRYYDVEDGRYISQDPIGLAGGTAFYGYVEDVNTFVDVFGLTSNQYSIGDVDSHGNLSPGRNRKKGHNNTKSDGFVQSHHPIQDAWAQKRVSGYNRNTAPATLLKSQSGSPHAKISAAQRTRRAKQGGWDTNLKEEFNTSYREMIDSGVSPKQAKKAIKDSYKYFDGLRSQNANNPYFNI